MPPARVHKRLKEYARKRSFDATRERLMAEIAFDEGGDVERAADADPIEAIRALARNPRTRNRKPHAKPVVWQSKRRKTV